MEDLKRIAPVTYAETARAGRWFVAALIGFGLLMSGLLFVANRLAARGSSSEEAPKGMSASAASSAPAHTIRLSIDGMECYMCALEIQEKFSKVPGVTGVKADFETGDTTIQCRAQDVRALSRLLAEALADTKYKLRDNSQPGDTQAPPDAPAEAPPPPSPTAPN